MFIIMNYLTIGWTQWMKGHDTVGEENDEVATLFTRKVFGSYDAAAKYIENYFVGRSENYTIRWNDRDRSLIDCIVTETTYSWEDEDEGGDEYRTNRLAILELENELS